MYSWASFLENEVRDSRSTEALNRALLRNDPSLPDMVARNEHVLAQLFEFVWRSNASVGDES